VIVHLHRDGLLERFGRPVPDAVAIAAALRRLDARLRGGPRRVDLAVESIRFAAADPPAPEDDVAGLPARRVDAPAALPAASLLFTASHSRCREAAEAGLAAYVVGLGVPAQERGLGFTDVPRVVEESLRLPTARPMAAGVRTGGLLAIPAADPGAARARILDVVRVDANADWVTLGDVLVLYTEEPDLEDRLAAEDGVERLSYGVNQQRLAVDLDRESQGAPGENVLLRRPGLALREVDGDAATAGAGALSWQQARRRVFRGSASPPAPGPSPAPPSSEDFRAALRKYEALTAEAAREAADEPAQAMLAALRKLAGPAAAPDLLRRDGQPAALAWTTPYESEDGGHLAVLIHDLAPGQARAEDALASAAAGALAAAEVLRELPGAPGALHAIRLRPGASPEEIWRPFLLGDERERVREVEVWPEDVEGRMATLARVSRA
jgi:hypothetical protein